MKLRRIVLIFIFGLALIGYLLLIPNDSINSLDYQQELLTQEQKDLIFNQINNFPNKTQMSISLIKGDSSIFYGAIKHNDTISEINNKLSLFEIGSITKVFTTTLLANFILDSSLTLNKKINNDLGFRLNNGIQISYLELANHTSGLPRRPSDLYLSAIRSPLNPYKLYGTYKLEKYLKEKVELNRKSGLEYEYSNLGMGVLEYALSQVAQSDYETLLKKKIFNKYRLTNTTSIRENIEGELVQGLGPFGNPIPNWDWGALKACGGLISSTQDLTRFVQAQFDSNNVELALTRESTFRVDSTLDIGLGWHIRKVKSNTVWHRHNGGTGGYRSSLVFDIENKTGVIILSNISVANKNKFLVDFLSFEPLKTITPTNIL